MRRILFALIILSSLFEGAEASNRSSNKATITVSNQRDLYSIRPRIDQRLKEGFNDITVRFQPGTYYYRNEQVNLTGKQYEGIALHFEGNGAVLIGEGRRYDTPGESSTTFSRYNGYITKDGDYLSVWGPVLESDCLAEVVDEESRLCRVHYGLLSDMNEDQCKSSHITLTESFDGKVFGIRRIEDGWVYFVASNLAKLTKDLYNINHDYYSGKRFPRFRLCNTTSYAGDITCLNGRIAFESAKGPVYECAYTRFFYAKESSFGLLEIKGFKFLGNKESSQLITFLDCVVRDSIVIEDCVFKNLHSDIIEVVGTDHVIIRNNYITKNFRWGIRSDNRSSDTRIENNVFTDCGLGLRNSACITCYGNDFHVARNRISNFGYAAIYAGLHYSTKKGGPVTGVIEYNEIWFDEEYRNDRLNSTLIDAGAIYLGPVHDRTIVRYNHIYDYVGVYSYNGVYCDDGASNCTIYGNVILGIADGYCIYSRRVAWIENNEKSYVSKANVGNVIEHNLIDGKFKFEGRPGENGCRKGANFVLQLPGGDIPYSEVSNIVNPEEDIIIQSKAVKDGKVIVSSVGLKLLAKYREYRFFNNYIEYGTR